MINRRGGDPWQGRGRKYGSDLKHSEFLMEIQEDPDITSSQGGRAREMIERDDLEAAERRLAFARATIPTPQDEGSLPPVKSLPYDLYEEIGKNVLYNSTMRPEPEPEPSRGWRCCFSSNRKASLKKRKSHKKTRRKRKSKNIKKKRRNNKKIKRTNKRRKKSKK